MGFRNTPAGFLKYHRGVIEIPRPGLVSSMKQQREAHIWVISVAPDKALNLGFQVLRR
jgi:hypothetical protein